jgi:acyl-CoA synthetase (AMP-forming)/AMP-acid ligase II
VDLPTLARLAAGEDDADITADGLREDDDHVLFFTSGSTGEPKGVPLSHRVSFLRSHPGGQLEPRGVMVCTFPTFHMAAWTIALQQWQARDGVVFVSRAGAEEICAAVSRHGAERLYCIPAVWRRVLDHPGAAAALGTVRFADTGTSATPPELLDALAAALLGAYLRVFYGSTEAGNVTALEHADLRRKPGSCGVPGPAVQVRRAPDGELLVRGPVVFAGYLDGSGLVDGWYRTGDLVDVDAEGYLSIVGRVRDVIRTGGETVAPVTVEAVLAGHPAIADVAVVGLPDGQWGEIVCAAVVPRPGHAAPTLAELRDFCADRLPRFARPRRVELVDAIPRTDSTAQVRRPLLTEHLNTVASPDQRRS